MPSAVSNALTNNCGYSAYFKEWVDGTKEPRFYDDFIINAENPNRTTFLTAGIGSYKIDDSYESYETV